MAGAGAVNDAEASYAYTSFGRLVLTLVKGRGGSRNFVSELRSEF